MYDELCAYTLTHGDVAFVHQHVVDAFTAQRATPATRPMQLVFAVVGLYLHVKREFSGRQVQRAHTMMARVKRPWPSIALPSDRGLMTAGDVMAVHPGADRDLAIDRWCEAVWQAYAASEPTVLQLLREYQIGQLVR